MWSLWSLHKCVLRGNLHSLDGRDDDDVSEQSSVCKTTPFAATFADSTKEAEVENEKAQKAPEAELSDIQKLTQELTSLNVSLSRHVESMEVSQVDAADADITGRTRNEPSDRRGVAPSERRRSPRDKSDQGTRGSQRDGNVADDLGKPQPFLVSGRSKSKSSQWKLTGKLTTCTIKSFSTSSGRISAKFTRKTQCSLCGHTRAHADAKPKPTKPTKPTESWISRSTGSTNGRTGGAGVRTIQTMRTMRTMGAFHTLRGGHFPGAGPRWTRWPRCPSTPSRQRSQQSLIQVWTPRCGFWKSFFLVSSEIVWNQWTVNIVPEIPEILNEMHGNDYRLLPGSWVARKFQTARESQQNTFFWACPVWDVGEPQRAWGNTYARAVRGRGNVSEMPPGQMQMRDVQKGWHDLKIGRSCKSEAKQRNCMELRTMMEGFLQGVRDLKAAKTHKTFLFLSFPLKLCRKSHRMSGKAYKAKWEHLRTSRQNEYSENFEATFEHGPAWTSRSSMLLRRGISELNAALLRKDEDIKDHLHPFLSSFYMLHLAHSWTNNIFIIIVLLYVSSLCRCGWLKFD